jgi:hypothetical protein
MCSTEAIEASRAFANVNCRQKPETPLGVISGHLDARTEWWG